jgi:hypothetical protein
LWDDPPNYLRRFLVENIYKGLAKVTVGDYMQNYPNQNTGNYEAQDQPPYQPPPQDYQQPYPQQDYGPPPGGDPYGAPPGAPPPGAPMGPMPPVKQSPLPLVAGILLIIVAIQAFAVGGILVAGAEIVGSALGSMPGAEEAKTLLMICGAIFIVFGIMVIIGGVSAITRKSFALALIGSILGIFTVGYYFTGSILSIVALILIAISKDEF